MGLFKPDPPKPPDYSPLIAASTKQTELATKLAQEQFDWAKGAYEDNKGLVDKVTTQFLDTMQTQADNAAKDRARYESTFQPLEDSLVADAQSYASPERKAAEMGRAQAGVAQQFEAKRQAASRELESYGINPSATRFAALDIGLRADQGAAEAAAADAAGRAVDDRAMALRADAINLGRGYPAQSLNEVNASGNAGQGAAGTANNATITGANTMGTGIGWSGVAGSSIGQTGSLMGQQYNDQLAYQKALNESSGWGSILGLVGGIGTKMLGFGSGGGVPSVAPNTFDMTNPSGFYSDGGPVKRDASPSAGAIPDDVPARLTAGEFVVPADVVRWKGEEFFHKLNENSRTKRAETTPPPKRMSALPGSPAFQSRAHAGLPVG